MRMWRNWQTRRFQVPVGDRMGSSPFIRTTFFRVKSLNFALFLWQKTCFARLFSKKYSFLGQILGKIWEKSSGNLYSNFNISLS